MKSVFIQKHQAEFSIKAMCRALKVARSDWYARINRRLLLNTQQQFRQHCDTTVSTAFHLAKQRYGAPCLAGELREQALVLNVKTMADCLRRQGLRAKASRKFRPVSYREYGLPGTENLLRTLLPAGRTRSGLETSPTDEPLTASLTQVSDAGYLRWPHDSAGCSTSEVMIVQKHTGIVVL